MNFIFEYLKKREVRRVFVFLVIILIIYLFRDLMTLFLLTFIFIYIFNSTQNFLYKYVKKVIPIKRGIIITFLYVAVLLVFAIVIRIYIPVIIKQSIDLLSRLTNYINAIKAQAPSDTSNNIYDKIVLYIASNVKIDTYIQNSGKALMEFLSNIGTTSLYVIMALILSIFFMIEKNTVKQFLYKFRNSRISWMFEDTRYLFNKFSNSFGKVIQTQILIALINAVLSGIILMFLGFPNILGLSAMIFILGMVPVAGVFISFVPLSIIAFSLGGMQKVIYVVILIVILHALESYVLNPKLMSHKTKLPIFFTFLILLVSEHLLGIWGLIIGIPIVMFLLDVLGVTPED